MGIVLFILGGVLGVLFLFHFLYAKGQRFSIPKLSVHFTSLAVPKLVQELSPNAETFNLLLAYEIFLISWCFGIIVAGVIFYRTHYLHQIRLIQFHNLKPPSKIFPFLYGVRAFDEEIKKAEGILFKNSKDVKLKDFISRVSTDVSQLLIKMNAALIESDVDGFMYFYMEKIKGLFFSETEARFTFRQLDRTRNEMVKKYTTRKDKVPGNIPLSKKNLIKLSLDLRKPVIYSRYSSYHFNTNNKSIKEGVYNDYVSYCILKTPDGLPFYSVCLDVCGESAINKMHLLVDSGIFTSICLVIAEKFLIIASDQTTSNQNNNLEINIGDRNV